MYQIFLKSRIHISSESFFHFFYLFTKIYMFSSHNSKFTLRLQGRTRWSFADRLISDQTAKNVRSHHRYTRPGKTIFEIKALVAKHSSMPFCGQCRSRSECSELVVLFWLYIIQQGNILEHRADSS